jgi:hypothetical protein
MAWIFSLSVECADTSAAEAVAAHFDGLALRVADRDVRCITSTRPDPESGWWAITCVPGMTAGSPIGSDPELCKAERMTEAARRLLEHLRTAPPFRYSMVGVEVDHFRCFSELDRDLVDRDFDGLVVSDMIWRQLGEPGTFEVFRPGYRWRPYTGEDADL